MTDLATPPGVLTQKQPTPTTLPPPATGSTQPPAAPTSSGPTPPSLTVSKVIAAKNAAPDLDPQTTVAAAQSSSSPAESAKNAQVVGAFSASTKLAKTLSSMPARAQLAVWNQASKSERDLLDAGGYTPLPPPPKDPAKPSGIFGDIWHGVAHQLDNVRHGLGSAADATRHLAAHDLDVVNHDVVNAGTPQISHGIRAVLSLADTNDLEYQQGKESLGSDLHALISPSSWLRAWHATKTGANSFQPQVVRMLQKSLTPMQLTLAKELASGTSPDDLIQKVVPKLPTAQRQEAAELLTKPTDAFSQAVKLLGDSHLTVGQAVFGGLSVSQEQKLMPEAKGLGAYSIAGGALGGAALGAAKANPVLAVGGAVLGAGANALAAAKGTTTDQLTTPFGLDVHPLSGITDGIVDWYSQPFIWGMQAREASNAARFAVKDALGTARDARAVYQSDSAVRRAMDGIAKALTTPSVDDAGNLSNKHPNINLFITLNSSLNPLADDFRDAYPQIKAAQEAGHGGEAVAEVFAGEQAAIRVASGRAGLYYHGETLFPHVTLSQAGIAGAKSGVSALIDKASGLDLNKLSPRQWARTVVGDSVEEAGTAAAEKQVSGPMARFASRGVSAFGRAAQRAVTLTPERAWIKLDDPDRAAIVQRYAKMFLPNRDVSRVVNGFMAIPPTDEGTQITFMRGLAEELMYAAGLDQSDRGKKYIEDWLQAFDAERAEGEHYSYGTNARYASPHSDQGAARDVAIGPSQLAKAIAMPDFRDLYKLSKKSWAMGVLDGSMDNIFLDKAMSAVWKPLLLLRVGFGVRVAGEELLGKILRDGLASVVQGRVAASMTGALDHDEILARKRVFAAMTSHIPEPARKSMKTVEDMIGKVFGWHAVNTYLGVLPGYDPQKTLEFAAEMAKRGELHDAFTSSIDAVTQHNGGYVDDESGWNQGVRRWGGGQATRMRPSGGMKSYSASDEEVFPAYHYALTGLTHDPLFLTTTAALPDGEAAQLDAALAWMHENPETVKRFQAAQQTPDGRLVSTGEASEDEAFRAWAQKVVAHVNHYLRSSSGDALVKLEDGTPLAEHIAQGNVPDVSELSKIARRDLPDEIVARRLVPDPGGFGKIIDKGMQMMVGRPLNWLSRQAIFTYNGGEAFADAKQMLASRGIADPDNDLAYQIAQERAVRETLPYIHNPHVRSQMSVITRNLAPFWFAQEQFYKRWARTFSLYPEAFRKAQLVMNGLRSVGFIQKDSYGEDSFVYPGSGFVTSFLAKTFFHTSLPVFNSFTSEVSQLNPSLEAGGLPTLGLGPFVTIPVSTLAAAFPELSPLAQWSLGPDAPALPTAGSWVDRMTNSAIGQFAPTVITRLLQWYDGSSNPNDATYSSLLSTAEVEAAQYLEATGHGPPKSQDVAEIDAWQMRLQNWTRSMMLMRAVFGFMGPATPAFQISGSALGTELNALMAALPYSEAVSVFMKAHPNASAYTVFPSTASDVGQSGAYIPETKNAIDFIDTNRAFFDKYPAAAPWLFPLSSQQGPFNDQVYQSELAMGLKARVDFPTWWQDVRYAEGANVYFPLEAKVTAAETKDPSAKQQLTHNWGIWADSFKAANPIFATMLEVEPTAASSRRGIVLQQLQEALKDDALPDSPQSQHIAYLMEGFQKVQDFYQSTQGESAYETQHTDNKDAFLAWGAEVAKAYPDVSAFWTGVLSKEVPG